MVYKKRFDGRKPEETREIKCAVGVIPNADGSAMFSFGNTKAIAAVYGPKKMHPRHKLNPEKAVLRCTYDMISFSVDERKRPGTNRRSSEISMVVQKALEPVIFLESFPNTVIDVEISIIEADASTRCAAINAASMALAHAGIPMRDMVASISTGCIGGTVVADLTKEEEDYEEDGEKLATDIPIAYLLRSGKVSLLQADGRVGIEDLKKAIALGYDVCLKVGEEQKKALKIQK